VVRRGEKCPETEAAREKECTPWSHTLQFLTAPPEPGQGAAREARVWLWQVDGRVVGPLGRCAQGMVLARIWPS
jgi:hypothetical protein